MYFIFVEDYFPEVSGESHSHRKLRNANYNECWNSIKKEIEVRVDCPFFLKTIFLLPHVMSSIFAVIGDWDLTCAEGRRFLVETQRKEGRKDVAMLNWSGWILGNILYLWWLSNSSFYQGSFLPVLTWYISDLTYHSLFTFCPPPSWMQKTKTQKISGNQFLTHPNSLSVSTSKMVGQHSFLK